MKKTLLLINTFALTLLFLASCGNDKAITAATPPPIQSYPVVTLAPQSVTLDTEYPATLEGLQNVDIRPKVDGFINRIFVDEGAVVKKGQLLFRIDAPQYEQQVRTAQAAISSAEADVNSAQLQVNKTKPLVDKDIISKYDLDAAQLTLQSRRAALAQAKAALSNARVNLGYTNISSPVDGIVGSIPFKTGSLVSSASALPLTTVSNISKVYAYFSLNEKQLLDFTRNFEGKTLEAKMKNMPPVSLVLSDGSIYTEKGKVESINGLINTATGSASLRATFPNPLTLLRSGGSAIVRIPQKLENVIMIPQKATTDLQGRKFVYVSDNAGVIKNTNIEIMSVTSGNYYVVTKGLKAGDKVVLEGFQTLKDGASIKPQEKPADSIYAALKNK